MNDDLFLRYGRAVFEVNRWTLERNRLRLEINNLAILPRNTKPQGNPSTGLPEELLKELGTGGRYHGVYAAVCRSLKVGYPRIQRVAKGITLDEPVMQGILAQIDLAEKRQAAKPQPLTPDERARFLLGGRYYGLIAETARERGINPKTVQSSVSGGKPNSNLLSAVRAAMAKRDAELTTKQVSK